MRSTGLTLAVVVSAAAACWLGWPGRIEPPRGPTPAEERAAVLARTEQNLAWADEESRRAVDRHIAPLDDFFAAARQGTPAFADAVLGWGSKWRFVADKLPFTSGGRHAAFLRRTFDDHLFKPGDLSGAIEQSARGYANALEGVENQMLVRLREDLSDLPPAALPQFADPSSLATAYDSALARALEHVGTNVEVDVAALLVSIVTEEVLTQVAVRLGVSAGILGAGAGASWATLGAGVVIGLIVDQLVTWVWDWWADPRGNLAADMNRKLADLHRLIVEGDEQTPGLRPTLAEFARQRCDVRRTAVLSLLGNGD